MQERGQGQDQGEGQGQQQWQVQDPGQELGQGQEQHRQGKGQEQWLWQALRGQVPGPLLAPGLLLASLQVPPLPMNLEPALVPQMVEQL